MINFCPFPEIDSDRIFLRKIEMSDSDEILFLRSDKTVTKYIERPEHRKTKNIADAKKFINELDEYIETNKSIAWGITLKTDPKIIGTICLWNFSHNNRVAEVGYDLNPTQHKKGIMDEALKLILNYGFNELELDKIEAFTHNSNENSKKLLERNGFIFNKKRKDLNNEKNIIFELRNFKR